MPRRSWMAMLAVTIGSASFAAAVQADEQPVQNTVRLQLQITGLTSEGCVLSIKPGHAGCQFTPIEKRIVNPSTGGMIRLAPIEFAAKSTNADHDCQFAITIREPNQPPRTYHRGVRLMPAEDGQEAAVQAVRVYLTAPSLASRDAATKPRR